MSKVLYIMRGVPGSGKSVMAELIAKATEGKIFSTDALWYDYTGNYKWNAALLGEKHRQNVQLAAEAMVDGCPSVIIDNTNIKTRDMKPYILLAKIHDYEIQVVQVMCSLELAIKRQLDRPSDRRIPAGTIRQMFQNMINDPSADGLLSAELHQV